MASAEHHEARNPPWTIAFPILAAAMLAAKFTHLVPVGHPAVTIAAIVLLAGAIFSAVHHAEIVALRVGEPLGSIILAVAVTVIEAGLIVALMLAAPDGGPSIARDTVYAAVMIVMTGLLGLCLVAGGRKHFEQSIQVSGTSSYLAVLGTLATIALILPNYTVTTPGASYSKVQLTAEALVSLGLYAAFLFVQTIRHRNYFLTDTDDGTDKPPPVAIAGNLLAASAVLLPVALASVVLLAKTLSPQLNALIEAANLPYDFAGVVIAALVLAPESIAAVRAALDNRQQTSINLALGSAVASIALTIPVIALVTAFSGVDLALGVSPGKTVLLVLAMFVSVITLGTGRTTVLQGAVHLSIFVIFLVLAAQP